METFPLRRLEQKEKKESFQDVSVVTCAIPETHSVDSRSFHEQRIERSDVEQAIQDIQDFIEQNKQSLDLKEKRKLEYILRYLPNFLKDQVANPSDIQLDENQRTHAMENIGTAMQDRLKGIQVNPLHFNEHIAHDPEARIRDLIHTLEKEQRLRVFSIADTHAYTPYLMVALDRMGVNLSNVGVLSFDHHTDLATEPLERIGTGSPMTYTSTYDSGYTRRRDYQGADFIPQHPTKEAAMSYQLATTAIGAIAVYGVSDEQNRDKRYVDERASVVPSSELYKDGVPKRELFMKRIESLLQNWQDKGITHVYPTVDADGLRLDELLYTGTDYNPYIIIRNLLAEWIYKKNATNRKNPSIPFMTADNLYMKTLHIDAPWNGIPASWVKRALDIMPKFGISVGIPTNKGDQRIVGDIVEHTLPDVQNRTQRIVLALMKAMLHTAR